MCLSVEQNKDITMKAETKPPAKRRNNEKRKEKSRVAARCRRNKEMELFNELTEAVPAPRQELDQLDKASVIRLAISYMRVRGLVDNILPREQPETKSETETLLNDDDNMSYLRALGGFLFVISSAGDIVYISDNISEYLGIGQTELMGQSVYEMSHMCDHDEIKEALRSRKTPVSFLARLKCTLTNKGRNLHIKSATYKVIHFTGHILDGKSDKMNVSSENKSEEGGDNKFYLVAVGSPIQHPSDIQIKLDSKTFLSKHGLDMKFTYTDKTMQSTLGYEPGDLDGKSLYDFHHTADSQTLAHSFKALFSKGQCETGQYRFLAKYGGYAWVQTQATVITDKQQKPISVVCVNHVISGIECKDEVFSISQTVYAEVKAKTKETILKKLQNAPNGTVVSVVPTQEEARPRPATSEIFARRTKEMNKGFLTFSQEDPGLTLLKHEPDDLTHLAPVAGDVCVPLETDFDDSFSDFLLNDNYSDLLRGEFVGESPGSFGTDTPPLASPIQRESESSCDRSSLPAELSLDTGFDSGLDCGTPGGRSDHSELETYISRDSIEKRTMWGAFPEDVRQAKPSPVHTGPAPNEIIGNIYGENGLAPTERCKRTRSEEQRTTDTKRARRGLSPDPVPASSVLMNLLDLGAVKVLSNIPKCQTNNQQPIRILINPPTGPPRQIQTNILNLSPVETSVAGVAQYKTGLLSPLTLNISSPESLSPQMSPYTSPQMSSPNMYPDYNRVIIPTEIKDPMLLTKINSGAMLNLQDNKDMLKQQLSPGLVPVHKDSLFLKQFSPHSNSMSPKDLLYKQMSSHKDPMLVTKQLSPGSILVPQKNIKQCSPGYPYKMEVETETNLSISGGDYPGWNDFFQELSYEGMTMG